MKKSILLLLTLILCFSLFTGCGSDNEETKDGVQSISSLKIAFSPYADADQIITSTEPLAELLKAKLLEKNYDVKEIDMTVGTNYTAVGQALSSGSADLGFIPAETMYCFPTTVMYFSQHCDTASTRIQKILLTGMTVLSKKILMK